MATLQSPEYRRSGRIVAALASVVAAASAASGQPQPEWVTRYSAPGAEDLPMAMAIDTGGNTYVTGRSRYPSGPAMQNRATTVKISPTGALAWAREFTSPYGINSAEGRAVAPGPEGAVYVAGMAEDPTGYGDLVLLKYDAADGTLLRTSRFNGGYGDVGWCIAVDPAGNVYVGGGTTGDGSDFLVVKFDSLGQLVWSRTHDGTGLSPFSADFVRRIALTPDGHVVVTGEAVNGIRADFVTIKYRASDGEVLWTNVYDSGGFVDEFPSAMGVDAHGDVYVTGAAGLNSFRYATVKINGETGAEVWSGTDLAGLDASAWGLALGPDGGVYITGNSDPDGNHSNFNDNYYTIKRRADDGAVEWESLYGSDALGHYDFANAVVIDSAGDVLVAGRSSTAPLLDDLLVIRYDAASGADLGHTVVEGVAPELANAEFLAIGPGQDVFVGGYFRSFSGGNYDYLVARLDGGVGCYADCNADGALTVADFGCFQTAFVTGGPFADCNADQQLTVADFGCFQTAFVLGCP